MNTDARALDLYNAASTHLVYHYPFIACPLLRLDIAFTNAVDSASTNGRTLDLNPEFWCSLTTEERVFVLAHESLHVAHMHHLRQGQRDSRCWNNAADYVVNAALLDAGFRLVEGALYESRYAEWSVEEVYVDLEEREDKKQQKRGQQGEQRQEREKKQQQQQQQQQDANQDTDNGNDTNDQRSSRNADSANGKGAPFGGSVSPLTHEDGSSLTPSELADQEAECQLAAYQATVAEAMSGNHNVQSAQRVVNAVSTSFDAREELREFTQRHAGREDYDWSRPSLSFLSSSNIYLPSISRANDLHTIIFAIDTSGSIRREHLTLMAGVIEDTINAYPKVTIHVIYADSVVRSVEEFDADSPTPIELKHAKGGGGTRFKPAFDYIASNVAVGAMEEPTALVYLTDLLGSDVATLREPVYPVLWATIGRTRRRHPFGRRVDIKPR